MQKPIFLILLVCVHFFKQTDININLKQKPLIRLSTFEDNSFETIKNISQDNFDCLKKDCDVLTTSYKQFVVFKYLQLNLKDYSTFIKNFSEIPIIEINYNIVTDTKAVLQANKLILNVLTSFKFFLDNAETFFKRKNGKVSTITKDFIKLTRNIYDVSFAYRFLTKLRNYSIHLGFPLEFLHIETDSREADPEKWICEIKLLVFLNSLKEEKDLFGGSVYNELMQKEDDIDLLPLINELSHHIIEIQKYIYRVQKNEIDEAIENIEYFVGNHKTDTNQIKVFSNYENIEGKISFSVYEIPFDIIKEYKMAYENWC